MMACLPPIMALEQAFFANLSQVAAYQSGGIQMALLDAEGDFLLEFDLAPEATVVGWSGSPKASTTATKPSNPTPSPRR